MDDPEAVTIAEAAAPPAWLPRTFRRVTTSGRYIPEVDGLRFVAIAAVFLYHLRAYLGIKSTIDWAVPYEQDPLAQLTHLGNAGVPLFFMISGFILGLPFASHWLKETPPIRLRDYFARRLTRLEPPYLISLTGFLVLLRVVNGLPWRVLLPGYILSAFYLHNLLGSDNDIINVVAWSLEVEVQFYVLAPVLALLFAVPGKLRRRLLIASLAYAAVVLQWFFLDYRGRLALTVLQYLQFFFAGFLLADFYLLDFNETPRRRPSLWDAVGLAAMLASVWALSREWPRHFLTPALFAVLMAATFRGRLGRWCLTRPWVTAIGGMCYSIYLIHYQVISLVGRFTKDIPFSQHFWLALIIQGVVVALPTLALSSLFFLIVEKPCMRKDWPRRLLAWFRSVLTGRSGSTLSAEAPARRTPGKPPR